MPAQGEMLVFLGDIKGTKSALESFETGGRALLERRIESLHDSFARCFARYSGRSRSMRAITVSDSVFAYWLDTTEGLRLALSFMEDLWLGLDHSLVRFRGFLDGGDFVTEASPLAHGLALTQGRFVKMLPVGVAAWSVAMAEASHFPDGLFVSRQLISQLPKHSYEVPIHTAGAFEYLQLTPAG